MTMTNQNSDYGFKNEIERVEETVERIKEASQQPRFGKVKPGQFFASIFGWVEAAGQDEPPYKADSRVRDKWLRSFIKKEPYFLGVYNSVVDIDSNRGWEMVGGRNQVKRFTGVLHNWLVAPGVRGWRPGAKAAAASFYGADIATVIELGRDGKGGPLRGLYHTDPARCRLTGRPEAPLRYHPPAGKAQEWAEGDFIRVTSLVETAEELNGLCYSAASRALELAKIMVAVYSHDSEQLGARAPKGILLLHGISEEQWDNSLRAREAKLDGMERDYYGGVQVLASEGIDQIKAKLVALSQLPAGFDIEKFTNLLMYGYALCVGYDPREFWPVSSGALGTASETETQHRKASGKGGLDFVLGLQEQLQRPDVLPPTIHFGFEQRDEESDILEAEVALAQIHNVREMFEAGLQAGGQGIIDREEARSLLAESGVIPHEWTEIEEDTTATDTQEERVRRRLERLLESERVQRAVERFPDEPLVAYRWPANRTVVLAQRAADALPRGWRVPRAVNRAEDEEPLYTDPDGDFTITEEDVERAIEKAGRVDPEIAEVLAAPELEGKA